MSHHGATHPGAVRAVEVETEAEAIDDQGGNQCLETGKEQIELPPHDGVRLLLHGVGNLDAWLIFGVLLQNLGTGLMLVNNLGQIVPALLPPLPLNNPNRETLDNYSNTETTVPVGADGQADALVSVFSVMSCMGRLSVGVLSEHAQRHHRVPRVAFFVVGSVISCGGMSLLALADGSPFRLTAATIFTGLSFGSMNTLLPACLADSFGMAHFAENMALMAAAAAPLASYLFASVLFATFYDEASREATTAAGGGNGGGSERECVGTACVRKIALVCGAGSLVAALLGAWLVQRSPLQHRS